MVDVLDTVVDGAFEHVDIGEDLMSQVVFLEVFPVALDVVELRRVGRQPLDAEPVLGLCQRGLSLAAFVDRPVVEHQMQALVPSPWLEALEKGAEGVAVLGAGGLDDELAAGVDAGAEERALVRLARGLDPQVGPAFGPDAGEIRVGRGLGLIGKEELDLPSFGPRLEPIQLLSTLRDGPAVLAPFERVARAPEAIPPFLRSRRLSQGWERCRPVRRSSSRWSRGSVQSGIPGASGSERICSSTSSARRPRCPEGPPSSAANRVNI
jgi:hypothetical protein